MIAKGTSTATINMEQKESIRLDCQRAIQIEGSDHKRRETIPPI